VWVAPACTPSSRLDAHRRAHAQTRAPAKTQSPATVRCADSTSPLSPISQRFNPRGDAFCRSRRFAFRRYDRAGDAYFALTSNLTRLEYFRVTEIDFRTEGEVTFGGRWNLSKRGCARGAIYSIETAG